MKAFPRIYQIVTLILLLAFILEAVIVAMGATKVSVPTTLLGGYARSSVNCPPATNTAAGILNPLFLSPPPWEMPKTEDYRPNWLLISQKRQVALTFIPKVMCVSLRQQFSVLDCGTTHFLQGSENTCATEARRNPQLQQMDISNMTRVLFIRDPFERALSAYKNSNTNGYIKLRQCRNRTVCTFSEWVDEISRDPARAFRNEHFKQQVEIAQFPRMHYHSVLRMSSPVDQRFFWENILNTTAVRANPTSTHAIEEMMEFFQSNETAHKLAAVYRDDVALWEQILLHGTPRQPGEETFYDYYKTMPQIMRPT